MKLKSIQQRYAKMNTANKEKRDKIDKRIEVLNRKLEWNKKRASEAWNENPSWIDEIIDPIAQLMLKKLPGRYYELLGPFGMCSRMSIHFYKNEMKELDRKEFFSEMTGDGCLSITFLPGDCRNGEIYLEDSLTDTGRFIKGTIGELNGMNHPSIEIPEDADEQWLVDWMLEQHEKDRCS